MRRSSGTPRLRSLRNSITFRSFGFGGGSTNSPPAIQNRTKTPNDLTDENSNFITSQISSKVSIESETDLLCDRKIEFIESGDVCSVVAVELIEQSAYFAGLLRYQQNSCKINLPEFLNAGFPSVAEFIRRGTTHLNEQNVYDVFIAADYLLVPKLKQLCCNFIAGLAQRDVRTAISLWVSCRSLYWPEIGRHALLRLLENFEKVIAVPEFALLELADVRLLLDNHGLNCRRESFVLKAVKAWCAQSPETRLQHAHSLLLCIRLGMLTSQELLELAQDDLVKRVPEYEKFLDLWIAGAPSEHSLTLARHERFTTPRLPHEVVIVFGGWCDGEGPRAAAQVFNTRANTWTLWSDAGRSFSNLPEDANASTTTTSFHAPPQMGMDETRTVANSPAESRRIGEIPRRVYAGCVVSDGRVFLIGGFDGTNALKSTLCYDFNTDSGWMERSCMYEKRYYVSVALCDGHIYALGGHNGENQGRLDSAERYNIAENQWRAIPPMNRVRSDAGAGEAGGKVYVVGGFEGRRYHDSSECFDPASGAWTMIARMSSPRGGVSVSSHGGMIYAFGGNDGSRRLRSIERYDPSTGRWDVTGQMSRSKSNLSSTVVDDDIYIIGGWSDEPEAGILNAVERFDTQTGQTQLVRQLCFPASATCSCTLKDKWLVRKYIHIQQSEVNDENNSITTEGPFSGRQANEATALNNNAGLVSFAGLMAREDCVGDCRRRRLSREFSPERMEVQRVVRPRNESLEREDLSIAEESVSASVILEERFSRSSANSGDTTTVLTATRPRIMATRRRRINLGGSSDTMVLRSSRRRPTQQ